MNEWDSQGPTHAPGTSLRHASLIDLWFPRPLQRDYNENTQEGNFRHGLAKVVFWPVVVHSEPEKNVAVYFWV